MGIRMLQKFLSNPQPGGCCRPIPCLSFPQKDEDQSPWLVLPKIVAQRISLTLFPPLESTKRAKRGRRKDDFPVGWDFTPLNWAGIEGLGVWGRWSGPWGHARTLQNRNPSENPCTSPFFHGTKDKTGARPGPPPSPALPRIPFPFSLLLGTLGCPEPIPTTAVGAVRAAISGIVFPVSVPGVPRAKPGVASRLPASYGTSPPAGLKTPELGDAEPRRVRALGFGVGVCVPHSGFGVSGLETPQGWSCGSPPFTPSPFFLG